MFGRARSATILLLAAACLSGVGQLTSILLMPPPDYRWARIVDHYDRDRYAGIDEYLPPRGVVGFVNDTAGDNDVQDYYLSQYVLTPRVLVEDPAQPLLLVNGRPGQPLRQFGTAILVGDLGNGVRVYRQGAP
jgi:hypothetical protein